MLELLTAPTAFGQPRNYRFMVLLASIKVDYEGVRENYQFIDVVVSSPTKEAIATLLAASDRLKDYAIADVSNGMTEFWVAGVMVNVPDTTNPCHTKACTEDASTTT